MDKEAPDAWSEGLLPRFSEPKDVDNAINLLQRSIALTRSQALIVNVPIAERHCHESVFSVSRGLWYCGPANVLKESALQPVSSKYQRVVFKWVGAV